MTDESRPHGFHKDALKYNNDNQMADREFVLEAVSAEIVDNGIRNTRGIPRRVGASRRDQSGAKRHQLCPCRVHVAGDRLMHAGYGCRLRQIQPRFRLAPPQAMSPSSTVGVLAVPRPSGPRVARPRPRKKPYFSPGPGPNPGRLSVATSWREGRPNAKRSVVATPKLASQGAREPGVLN